MKIRADQLLVNTGLAPSKSAAQKLIESGQVLLPDGSPVRKPAQGVDDSLQLNVLQELKYVSRGAYKLLPAIEKFSPALEGKTALDLGASTGGFTDVLLQHGNRKVVFLSFVFEFWNTNDEFVIWHFQSSLTIMLKILQMMPAQLFVVYQYFHSSLLFFIFNRLMIDIAIKVPSVIIDDTGAAVNPNSLTDANNVNTPRTLEIIRFLSHSF